MTDNLVAIDDPAWLSAVPDDDVNDAAPPEAPPPPPPIWQPPVPGTPAGKRRRKRSARRSGVGLSERRQATAVWARTVPDRAREASVRWVEKAGRAASWLLGR